MNEVVVIGREPCETSRGPIAVGELVRLPLVEAIHLHNAGIVSLGDFREQHLPDPIPQPKRHWYRRRDLRADP